MGIFRRGNKKFEDVPSSVEEKLLAEYLAKKEARDRLVLDSINHVAGFLPWTAVNSTTAEALIANLEVRALLTELPYRRNGFLSVLEFYIYETTGDGTVRLCIERCSTVESLKDSLGRYLYKQQKKGKNEKR